MRNRDNYKTADEFWKAPRKVQLTFFTLAVNPITACNVTCYVMSHLFLKQ